jgi:hypothetical protein
MVIMRKAVLMTAILIIIFLAQSVAVEANPFMFGPEWKIWLPEQSNSKIYQTSTVPIEVQIYTPTDYPKITKSYYIIDLNYGSNNNPQKVLTISEPQNISYYAKPSISYLATGTSDYLSNGNHTIDVYSVNTNGEILKSYTRTFQINATSEPTPSVPEFSLLTILPLLLSLFSFAMIVRYRKTANLNKALS